MIRRRWPVFAVAAVAMALGAVIPVIVVLADPGEVRTPANYHAPCWVTTRTNAPSGTWELVVGNLFGGIVAGTNVAVSDAYFDDDSGDCGYGDFALDTGMGNTPVTFVVDSAVAYDTETSEGGNIAFEFVLERWDGDKCTGTLQTTETKTWSFSFPTSTRDWFEPDVWDSSSTGFAFVRNTPSSAGTHWYKYKLTTTVPGVSAAVQTGCVRIRTT
jgi:hypothetical protein